MNRLFFLFVFVLFLVPTDDVWARGETFASGAVVKRDIHARPGNYRAGVRDAVWEAALNPKSNRVHDPLIGKFIGRHSAWDMGHKPGYEFYKYRDIARQRRISRNLFLDGHNNSAHYHPELPRSNRGHQLEAPKKINHYKKSIRGYGKRARFTSASNVRHVKAGSPPAAKTLSSAKFVKIGNVVYKIGGAVVIAGGALDMGYGVHKYYTAHQRYLAGELDWDIAAGKKVLAVGHVILGSGGVTVGVLLLVAPEPVFTKVAGVILVVAGATYLIVDYVLDNYLEKLQAKRTLQRQETLARISWQERQKVCIDQLRQAI